MEIYREERPKQLQVWSVKFLAIQRFAVVLPVQRSGQSQDLRLCSCELQKIAQMLPLARSVWAFIDSAVSEPSLAVQAMPQ